MAVSAPVRRVIFTANESKKGVTQGREGIKNIGQVILKRTKVKREAFAQTNLFRKRREESEKRMMLEDELEAPRVAATPTGAQQLVEKTGAKGFFNRILGFIGYLAAGWLMNNLPTWIAIGKEFIARIQKAGEIVSGFFNNTIKLFTGVGSLLSSLGQNLLQFDFFDTSNRVKNSMSELNNTMGSLTGQIEEAFSLLTTPLTEGKYSGEEIPKTGTQQTDQGAYEEPPPYSGSGGGGASGADKLILDLIASVEAGKENYDSVNGGSRTGKPPTQSTIGEIARSGQGATGRYQHMPAYILGRAKSAGFNEKTLFTPAVQDKITLKFLEDGHSYSAWKSGKITDRQFAQKLAVTWRGLPYDERNLTYQDRYARYNKAHTTFANVLSKLSSAKKSPQQPSKSGSQPTVVSAGPAQYTKGTWETGGGFNPSGAKDAHGRPVVLSRSAAEAFAAMMRDSGGKVKGSDIASSQRSPAKNRSLPGASPTSKHLKGLALDIHGSSDSWIRKFGSKYGWYANDYSGTHGGHFEFRGPSTPTKPPTPAQIAAAPQQSQTVPSALTPERRGQDIVIIDQPRQQQNIITPAASGGAAPSPISDFDLLNNFIKNKLLLDLAYL